MATPQYTIKTGADSSDYFCREVTISDKLKNYNVGDNDGTQLGKVKKFDYNISDDYSYPVLVRRTGDSLKGSTESIESQELRKGRTKSAPRKGSSSSEGSLDFELSPETYDDILEAALRGEWKEWLSDSKVKGLGDKDYVPSGSNLDKLTGYPDGTFESKIVKNGSMLETPEGTFHPTLLVSNVTDKEDDGVTDKFSVVKVSNKRNIEVHELTCGTQDIRYSVLKHFGGVKDDDLFQCFEHLAVNTMSLSVTPGQIITGSFGFMGSNNPEIVQWGNSYTKEKKWNASLKENGYYTTSDGGKTFVEAQNVTEETFNKGTTEYYSHTPNGVIKQLEGRVLTGTGSSAETVTNDNLMKWIENLPQKGTSTDQYTAREGFLYINGERVRYGSNLTFELNNGLNKTFAIFEKDAIAMSPLTLDITGSLGAYLIKGYSEKLYQLAVQDKDIELVFCFQDKEDNPEALYLFQIFKAKFTDTDVSSGAENLEVTFPYQSFEEKAVRVLRLRTRKARKTILSNGLDKITVEFTTAPLDIPTSSTISCKATVDGVDLATTLDTTNFETSKTVDFTFGAIEKSAEATKEAVFTVTYNGKSITSVYTIPKSE